MIKIKKNKKIRLTPSSTAVHGQPHDVFDLLNKYGTYNIQPTNDGAWEYPAIMQGLSLVSRRHTEGERAAWKKEQAERLQKHKENN